MTDNERIAKFMGMEWDSFERKHMDFSNDWNWLMLVVEKIEARERTLINIYSDGTKLWVDDKDGNELFATTKHWNKDDKIGHVYRAVVEFIKWFETRGAEE